MLDICPRVRLGELRVERGEALVGACGRTVERGAVQLAVDVQLLGTDPPGVLLAPLPAQLDAPAARVGRCVAGHLSDELAPERSHIRRKADASEVRREGVVDGLDAVAVPVGAAAPAAVVVGVVPRAARARARRCGTRARRAVQQTAQRESVVGTALALPARTLEAGLHARPCRLVHERLVLGGHRLRRGSVALGHGDPPDVRGLTEQIVEPGPLHAQALRLRALVHVLERERAVGGERERRGDERPLDRVRHERRTPVGVAGAEVPDGRVVHPAPVEHRLADALPDVDRQPAVGNVGLDEVDEELVEVVRVGVVDPLLDGLHLNAQARPALDFGSRLIDVAGEPAPLRDEQQVRPAVAPRRRVLDVHPAVVRPVEVAPAESLVAVRADDGHAVMGAELTPGVVLRGEAVAVARLLVATDAPVQQGAPALKVGSHGTG